MFQPETQRLVDQWGELARTGPTAEAIPDRSAFAAEALGSLLPRAFMVDRRGEALRLGVVGGSIELLHDRPLAGADLLELWSEASRPLIVETVAQAFAQARPMVVVAQAGETGALVEVVLAPLRGSFGRPDRILGLMTPIEPITLGDEPTRLTARLAVAADVRRPNDPAGAAATDRRLA